MANNTIRRSVDSLQKIYAVIIALSIGSALLSIINGDQLKKIKIGFIDQAPELITFFLLVIPFYHGMNRHLDRVYIEDKSKKQGAIIIDFFIFIVEAALILLFSTSIKFGVGCYPIIATILIVDIIWAFVTYFIHYFGDKPSTLNWGIINTSALFLGFVVYSFSGSAINEENSRWIICIIFVLRSVFDYVSCWKFYFPNQEQ